MSRLSLPEDLLAPFSLGAGKTGVLLVHGFTGTPYDMREFAVELAERGHRVAVPRLAGHAGGEEALAHTTWQDWWESLVPAYAELQAECERVVVCGLSMGGLLSLKLAAHYPVAGVVAMATPLYLEHWALPLVPWVQGLVRFRSDRGKTDIRDEAARARAPDVGRTPLAGLATLMDLMGHVDELLPEVRRPALLIYSRLDATVPYGNLRHLTERIGCVDLTSVTLENSGHVVTVDCDRRQVFDAVAEFVEKTTI